MYRAFVTRHVMFCGKCRILLAACVALWSLHGHAGALPDRVLLIRTHDNVETKVKATREGWRSVPGKTYAVDWSLDLAAGWSNVADGSVQATGSVAVWYDTGPPRTAPFSTNHPGRFYRVRLADSP